MGPPGSAPGLAPGPKSPRKNMACFADTIIQVSYKYHRILKNILKIHMIILASSLHIGQILVAVNLCYWGILAQRLVRHLGVQKHSEGHHQRRVVGPTLSQWPHGGNDSMGSWNKCWKCWKKWWIWWKFLKKKHQIHFFEVQFADGLNWHERWKLPDFIGIFHLNFIISMKPSWTLSGASNNYGSLGGLPCGIFMMVKPAHWFPEFNGGKPAHDGLWHVVAHPTVGE